MLGWRECHQRGGWRMMTLPASLPRFRGIRSQIASGIYFVVTFVAISLFAGTLYFGSIDLFRHLPLMSSYGFKTVTLEDGTVATSQPSLAAARRGMKLRDRIVAINGKRVSPRASEFGLATD